MVLAYTIDVYDNDSYMLGEETQPVQNPESFRHIDWMFVQDGHVHPAICGLCGSKMDPNYLNPDFKLRKKKFDLSMTYDGYLIASEAFREFCEERNIPEVEFVDLPSEPGFYWFRALQHLPFDTDYCEQSHLCAACGHFSSVILRGYVLKDITEPLQAGLFFTDVQFATSHEQFPLLIAGVETAQALRESELQDLAFTQIQVPQG